MSKPTENQLDKIIEFIKYEPKRNGWSEWVSPIMNGYKMQCCDCGLIHEVDFKIVRFKGKPDNNGRSETTPISNKDIQVLLRMRRLNDGANITKDVFNQMAVEWGKSIRNLSIIKEWFEKHSGENAGYEVNNGYVSLTRQGVFEITTVLLTKEGETK